MNEFHNNERFHKKVKVYLSYVLLFGIEDFTLDFNFALFLSELGSLQRVIIIKVDPASSSVYKSCWYKVWLKAMQIQELQKKELGAFVRWHKSCSSHIGVWV